MRWAVEQGLASKPSIRNDAKGYGEDLLRNVELRLDQLATKDDLADQHREEDSRYRGTTRRDECDGEKWQETDRSWTAPRPLVLQQLRENPEPSEEGSGRQLLCAPRSCKQRHHRRANERGDADQQDVELDTVQKSPRNMGNPVPCFRRVSPKPSYPPGLPRTP